MKSASLAIEPLMLAERDREYLKQLRRNRWAEVELSRNNAFYTIVKSPNSKSESGILSPKVSI